MLVLVLGFGAGSRADCGLMFWLLHSLSVLLVKAETEAEAADVLQARDAPRNLPGAAVLLPGHGRAGPAQDAARG